MSTLHGLKAARLLYGPAPDRTPEPADAGEEAGEDALFEAWATGYRQGLRDGKERAPVVRIYPLVALALDTGDSAGGPQS